MKWNEMLWKRTLYVFFVLIVQAITFPPTFSSISQSRTTQHPQFSAVDNLLTEAHISGLYPSILCNHLLAVRSVNPPGRTGSCGGCDPKPRPLTCRMKTGLIWTRRRSTRWRRMRSTLWRSDRTCTQASWSTASVTTSLSSASSHWRWESGWTTLTVLRNDAFVWSVSLAPIPSAFCIGIYLLIWTMLVLSWEQIPQKTTMKWLSYFVYTKPDIASSFVP